jgi:hypothetical protein
LFDLLNDPYEETNLYYSSVAEHIQVKEDLYALLPNITAKAKKKISIKWSDVAQNVWSEHGDLVVPWAKADVTIKSPKYCIE